MKQLFACLIPIFVLTACNRDARLIKEHIKKDYFDEPSASFSFEKIQKDSVYTVSDSIRILLEEYNLYSGFVSHIAARGYILDSMELVAYIDSTGFVIEDIREAYHQSVTKLTHEINELQDLLDKSQAAGMGSFMSALGSLAGTRFEDELERKRTELKEDYETLDACNQIEAILTKTNELTKQNPQKELCQFWYAQFIVKTSRGSISFDKRFAYKYLLAPINGEFAVVERKKIK